jgi:peptidoglycan/xylan/chitin deacetylase (PgdA/CDA1 family)
MSIRRFGRFALYEKARKAFSRRGRGRLSKLLVHAGLKPAARRVRAAASRQGTVVFSADFEMAWAFRYSRALADRAEAMGLAERKHVPRILEIFERWKIPVTWATVGHLFLRECRRGASGRPHAEMPRPGHFENGNWSFTAGDWYDHDPCSGFRDHPAWYAGDLVDLIVMAGAGHEIACHTFSHVDFKEVNCPRELAAAELDACAALAETRALRLKSMVFPGGGRGHFGLLKERGFLCYRKPMAFHLDQPEIDPLGLVAIPSSLGLDRDPYGWTREFHIGMLRRFLKKTVKTGLVCHFWFHPSMDEWYLEGVLPDLVAMVAELRDQGALRVRTMAQLAEETLAGRAETSGKR